MNTISITQLTKLYGNRVGVKDVSLDIPAGCLFGFLGPNGAGKSTTIRILLGLLRPTEGAARIFDKDCWQQGAAIRRGVGYLPGDLRLYPWLTCRYALRLFGGIRQCEMETAGLKLAEEFNLDIDCTVRAMSRGMRQQLGLILALAHQPDLLILDEPTISLDPLAQDILFRHLRRAVQAGRTVMLSSHTLSEVEDLCDRVGILRKGKLVAHECLADLRSRAARRICIRWKDPKQATSQDPPPFLTNLERGHSEWNAAMTGSAEGLIQWCAQRPIEDIIIEKPELSELFRQYYYDPEAPS